MSVEIKIYNTNKELVAILENAYGISIETELNKIYKASFYLPGNDSKNNECLPFRYVEIFQNGYLVDLFRLMPSEKTKTDLPVIKYTCEHVIATLMDDVFFRYYQIGGTGVYTDEVIEYILSQQTVNNWQLGTCEFSRQFQYKFENENLLGALFSVPKPFDSDYIFTYDINTTPWTLNLVELDRSANPSCYIRYKKNLQGITKYSDPSQLCTRLYCLGYGEGDNQLTIEEENDGIPYLDADTQDQYGIISQIWTDRRFEHAETLKARGEAILEELKNPYTSYKIEAAELFQKTERNSDKFTVGSVVSVIDEELDEEFKNLIISIKRSNIDSEPWNCSLEIANKSQDIAGSISELADRQRINEVYSQGATNLDTRSFADNCDTTHPATIEFYIPSETVRINKALLSWKADKFRAFSTATATQAASTPSTSTLATSTPTTSMEPASTPTTEVNPGSTPSSTIQPSSSPVSGPINESSVWSDTGYPATVWSGLAYDTSGYQPITFTSDQSDGTVGYHSHNTSIDNHIHLNSMAHSHLLGTYPHTHTATYPAHWHNVTIPAHSHSVVVPAHYHTVTIPAHYHTVTIPAHTHAITYGIYEGPQATSLTIKVDGNTLPGNSTSGSIDIVSYMSTDSEGKITRGAWHTITITPNSLSRIVANLILQFFVQSRGTGNY